MLQHYRNTQGDDIAYTTIILYLSYWCLVGGQKSFFLNKCFILVKNFNNNLCVSGIALIWHPATHPYHLQNPPSLVAPRPLLFCKLQIGLQRETCNFINELQFAHATSWTEPALLLLRDFSYGQIIHCNFQLLWLKWVVKSFGSSPNQCTPVVV